MGDPPQRPRVLVQRLVRPGAAEIGARSRERWSGWIERSRRRGQRGLLGALGLLDTLSLLGAHGLLNAGVLRRHLEDYVNVVFREVTSKPLAVDVGSSSLFEERERKQVNVVRSISELAEEPYRESAVLATATVADVVGGRVSGLVGRTVWPVEVQKTSKGEFRMVLAVGRIVSLNWSVEVQTSLVSALSRVKRLLRDSLVVRLLMSGLVQSSLEGVLSRVKRL